MAEELFRDKDWRPRLLDEQPPQIMGIENLDGGAVVIRVQARTAPQKNVEIARELRRRIKSTLDEAGIEVVTFAAAA